MDTMLKLNHAVTDQSVKICQLMHAAYQVEARLLGVPDFPPLRRQPRDIAASVSEFYGCMSNSELVGVIETEADDQHGLNISSLCVLPSFFRRGIASQLLKQVTQNTKVHRVTVSTAEANQPAISLYLACGFVEQQTWQTHDGITMITLEMASLSGSTNL